MPQILIVDNDSDTRELYKYALKDLVGDENIVTVSSGSAALEYLERNPGIKLVLLDLAMPVLDGLTTAEEIRRNEQLHESTHPVMLALLTGHQIHEVDEHIADRAHVERPFLEKDGDTTKVSKQVQRWLLKAA